MHFTLSLKNVLSLAQFSYCSAFLKPVNGAVWGITVHLFTWASDSGVACSVMPLSYLIYSMLSDCNLYFANFLPDCCQWTWCIENLTFSSEFHVDPLFHSLFLQILPSMRFCVALCNVLVLLHCKVISSSPIPPPGGLCHMRCLWQLIQIPHHVWGPCSAPVTWGYVICHGDWCTDVNEHKLYKSGLNTVSKVW
jgi:hypothetical protein